MTTHHAPRSSFIFRSVQRASSVFPLSTLCLHLSHCSSSIKLEASVCYYIAVIVSDSSNSECLLWCVSPAKWHLLVHHVRECSRIRRCWAVTGWLAPSCKVIKITVYIIRHGIVVYSSPYRCNCKVWCHVRRLIRETWFKNYISSVRRHALLLNEALSTSNLRKVKKTYRTCPIRRNSTPFIQSLVWEMFLFAANLVMLVSEVAKYTGLC